MDKKNEAICRLCMEPVKNSFVTLSKNTKMIIKSVIPYAKIEQFSKNLLCAECMTSLNDLYNFKTMCCSNEAKIQQHTILFGENKDLKDIISVTDNSTKNTDSICRLCLTRSSEKYENIHNSEYDPMLTFCLSEIDVKLTINPQICSNCVKSLSRYNKFNKLCYNIEEMFSTYRKEKNITGRKYIEVNKVLRYFKKNEKTTEYNETEMPLCIIESVETIENDDQSLPENVVESQNNIENEMPRNIINLADSTIENKKIRDNLITHQESQSQEKLSEQTLNSIEDEILQNIYECPKCYYDTIDRAKFIEHRIKTDNFKLCAKISRSLYLENEDIEQNNSLKNYYVESINDIIYDNVNNETSYIVQENNKRSNKINNVVYTEIQNLDIKDNCNILCEICCKFFTKNDDVKNHLIFTHFMHISSTVCIKLYKQHILRRCNKIVVYDLIEKIIINNKELLKSDITSKNLITIFPEIYKFNNIKYTYDKLNIFENNLISLRKLRHESVTCTYMMCFPCFMLYSTIQTIKTHFYKHHNITEKNYAYVTILNERSEELNIKSLQTSDFSDILILNPIEHCYVDVERICHKNSDLLDLTLDDEVSNNDMCIELSDDDIEVSTDDIEMSTNIEVSTNDIEMSNDDMEINVDMTENRDITKLLETIDEDIEEIRKLQDKKQNEVVESVIMPIRSIDINNFDMVNIPETIEVVGSQIKHVEKCRKRKMKMKKRMK